MILLDRVSKVYGKKHTALSRISIHIEPKEFVSIVGASGAGKSTLIKLLTREEEHDSGKIIVNNVDYDHLKRKDVPKVRRNIGVVFQDYKLLPNKTVYENISFALEIVGTPTRVIKHSVPKVIKLVGLSGKENNFPSALSGGERQRVAIARAVIRQPKILIADEPTGNLDPKHAWDIIALLLKINKHGTTVLLTTHNQDIVNALKRRVITIKDGRILRDKAKGDYKV
jgi:cell division transport system ATP-binding protein